MQRSQSSCVHRSDNSFTYKGVLQVSWSQHNTPSEHQFRAVSWAAGHRQHCYCYCITSRSQTRQEEEHKLHIYIQKSSSGEICMAAVTDGLADHFFCYFTWCSGIRLFIQMVLAFYWTLCGPPPDMEVVLWPQDSLDCNQEKHWFNCSSFLLFTDNNSFKPGTVSQTLHYFKRWAGCPFFLNSCQLLMLFISLH